MNSNNKTKGAEVSDSFKQAKAHMQDLNIGDIGANFNHFKKLQMQQKQGSVNSHKSSLTNNKGFRESSLGQQCIISPIPGNTPPILVDKSDSQTNREFQQIQNFLRQNQVMPGSRSDLNYAGSKQLSSGRHSNDSEALASETGAGRQLSTFIHYSKGVTIDTQMIYGMQAQLESLQSSVSLLIEKTEAHSQMLSTPPHGKCSAELVDLKTVIQQKLTASHQQLLDKVDKQEA